jgi:pre-mRNA-splicing factor ISY1
MLYRRVEVRSKHGRGRRPVFSWKNCSSNWPEDDDGARKGGEKRSELRQKVDAGYYGYNLDEEDGTLLAYEVTKEKEAWDHFMTLPDDLSEKPGKVQKEWIELPGDAGDGVRWQVPTLEEVNNELVERRRRKLLEKLG